jgi:perosamine synthetase
MKEQKVRQIPFGKPMIGPEENNAVLDVLSGTVLVHGPRAVQFESDFAHFTQASHAVSVSSCTAGMHLIWFHLGYGPGDEVIVPAMTHTATAHAVELCGAKPVFVDAELRTGNIDLEQLESKINDRTRAIAVVHYLGMPVNMDAIMALAQKYQLFVLEDCALAVGSYFQGVHAGLIGDAGCFSFYPVKHMTTAEGGMIITKDQDLASALRLKRAFGVDRNHGERSIPGMYDVVELGFNYRMSELHAAMGIEQIKKVPEFLRIRQENYQYLEAALQKLKGLKLFQSTHNEFKSSYYCLSVLLSQSLVPHRETIMAELKELGIGTSIYYPQPVPRMKYYREKYGYHQTEFSNAAIIADSSIAFPVGPHLNTQDMEYISASLQDILLRLEN